MSSAETYLHAIDLKNPIVCHNIRFTQRLTSVDFAGQVDPGLSATHRCVGDISVAELREGFLEGNVISARMGSWVLPGVLLEAGLTLVDGFDVPIDVAESTRQRVIDTMKIELAFEEGRRLHAPNAPSRLSCIFLVENSAAGRAYIANMLRNRFTLDVVIEHKLAMHRADSNWYDEYLNSQRVDAIERYWTEQIHPSGPTWELLFEGAVRIDSPEQLAHVKEHGVLAPNGKATPWR